MMLISTPPAPDCVLLNARLVMCISLAPQTRLVFAGSVADAFVGSPLNTMGTLVDELFVSIRLTAVVLNDTVVVVAGATDSV